ncbi:hypothetical protein LIER_30485 [Lithospermum erythrorhizon]|uniref:Uncharacterized protein n=1 Tax=Lithospermum erythrorhizon TaxID=34254 RepID=A0AAV3RPN4_LITER
MTPPEAFLAICNAQNPNTHLFFNSLFTLLLCFRLIYLKLRLAHLGSTSILIRLAHHYIVVIVRTIL